jgi:hypothetical protein
MLTTMAERRVARSGVREAGESQWCASHHKDLARSKRVFDYVQRLIEELVQALALGVEQLRNDEARAGRVRFPARP